MKYKFLFGIVLGACLALFVPWAQTKTQDLYADYHTEKEICDVVWPGVLLSSVRTRSHGMFQATPEQRSQIIREKGHTCYHQITYYGWDTWLSYRTVSKIEFNRCALNIHWPNNFAR